MKLFFFFILSIWFFILSGCVSTSSYWQDKVHTPVKKGTLYYSPLPNLFDPEAVEKRRMDAEMKMNSFCRPQTPQIVSEKNKEEVTGYQTHSSSRRDNPLPQYQSKSYTSQSSGRSHYSKHSSSLVTNPSLHASETTTSTPITRKRVYIDFVCK